MRINPSSSARFSSLHALKANIFLVYAMGWVLIRQPSSLLLAQAFVQRIENRYVCCQAHKVVLYFQVVELEYVNFP